MIFSAKPVSTEAAITFSPSVTVTLTHDCPWHCRYCGFRTDGEGLISDEAVGRILERGRRFGATEALLISGERPDRMKHLREEARERGFAGFWEFAESVAERCLEAGLLPHGNYGALGEAEWQRLRGTHVSMGVMLESVEDVIEAAPEKNARGRLESIEAAGRARVPFTTGLLLGYGESEESRYRSLDALADLHARYGHLQEILLQPCVANPGLRLDRVEPIPASVLAGLAAYWKRICPDVPVQIPPNVTEDFLCVVDWVDDIGGISPLRDEVNPTSPWEKVDWYREQAERHGRLLKERLPVYEKFCHPSWLDERFAGLVKCEAGI